jgi:5-methylcytosine-specific restriction endonuclease McrA
MRKEETRRNSLSELFEKLYRRSGARCEGYQLDLDCTTKLTKDSPPLIHHLDGNPGNNEINNLVLLCPNCHSKVIEELSEKRRKAYVKKVAENLDKLSFAASDG